MIVNSSPIQAAGSGRAYFVAAAFVAPAVVLGFAANALLLPKVEVMSARAGVGAANLWPFSFASWVLRDGLIALAALAAVLLLAELVTPKMARYRCWSAGAVAFVTNSAVLLALAALCVAAVLAV